MTIYIFRDKGLKAAFEECSQTIIDGKNHLDSISDDIHVLEDFLKDQVLPEYFGYEIDSSDTLYWCNESRRLRFRRVSLHDGVQIDKPCMECKVSERRKIHYHLGTFLKMLASNIKAGTI